MLALLLPPRMMPDVMFDAQQDSDSAIDECDGGNRSKDSQSSDGGHA